MSTVRSGGAVQSSGGTATISGHIVGERGAPRIRISGPRAAVPLVLGGRWECSGLPPGRYRVELVDARRVLAREIEVFAHREHFVDFELR